MNLTSCIVTYREPGDPERRRNLNAVLEWLRLQELGEVIVVEQDTAPTLGDIPPFQALRVVFAFNPGPFNKSWGFNVGARMSKGNVLVFADADLLCRSLPKAVAAARGGVPAIRAFSHVLDLGPEDSEILRTDLSCLSDPSFAACAAERRDQGEHAPLCGGMIVMQRRIYLLVGGWDERFLGWGGEDDAMDIKLGRAGIRPGLVKDSAAFHLHHRRAVPEPSVDTHYRANLALLRELREMPDEALRRMCEISLQIMGYPEMHRPLEPLQ